MHKVQSLIGFEQASPSLELEISLQMSLVTSVFYPEILEIPKKIRAQGRGVGWQPGGGACLLQLS